MKKQRNNSMNAIGHGLVSGSPLSLGEKYWYDVCHIQDLQQWCHATSPAIPSLKCFSKRSMQVIDQKGMARIAVNWLSVHMKNYPIQNQGSQAIHVWSPEGRGKITPPPPNTLAVGTCRHHFVSSQNRSRMKMIIEGKKCQWWLAML